MKLSTLLLLHHFFLLGAVAATTKPRAALEDCLQDAVNGDAARAQFSYEPGFEEKDVRPYNLNYRRKPFAILYPKTSAEVSGITQCAAKSGRKVQARSGGNDYTNTNSGTGVATVGPGHRQKTLVEGLHAQGKRYLPTGASAGLAVGGFATIGGVGLTTRLEGTLTDTLVQAEVVLANGTIVKASAEENADLFWAVRGAGRSFGIVTEFQFQTKPEPKEVIDFGFVVSSTSAATLANAFQTFQEIARDKDLDNKLGVVAVASKDSLRISGAYFGPRSGYDKIDLQSRIPNVSSGTVSKSLTWIQHANNTFGSIESLDPRQTYFYAHGTAINYATLPTNDTIEALFEHLQKADSGGASWFILMDFYGGAVRKLAVDATSFPHRDIAYFVSLYASSNKSTTQTTYDFVDKAVLAVQGNQPEKYLTYAGYTNDRVKGNLQKNYWGPNLPRLQKIKAAYDPKDLFSTLHTVKANGRKY
ncbi:hypothetical protein QQZ08_006123 [Neonectria magnoliae]|uniref:FAD-binding PCMH-type domain-containing protein n=1 Tax=Neonectria magnoliae TaxID=2732573 RepID=A0ABR1I2S4_9HYPO